MGTPVTSSLALDPKALASLKAQAGKAPDQASLKQAATQFEAVFMNMMLKSMRDTLSQDGPTDDDSTRTYTGMLDQQLSQTLAGGQNGKGIGLADMIVKQLSGQIGAGADTSSTSGGTAKSSGVTKAEVKAEVKQLKTGIGIATSPSTSGHAQKFIDKMMPDARAASDATGVPAQFILAQAALESGWGRSEVRGSDGTASHNVFGVKAGKDWKGATVEASTTEYVNGVAQRVTQKFRAYGSYAESFADYAKLIASSSRYKNVVAQGQGQSATGFAVALQQAGYASDPGYAAKINHIIQTKMRGLA